MFKKLGPQKVQHLDGYTVEVADRYSVEYFDDHCRARIDVDFGPTDIAIYLHSLTLQDGDGSTITITDPTSVQQNQIIERVVLGLKAMGCQVKCI